MDEMSFYFNKEVLRTSTLCLIANKLHNINLNKIPQIFEKTNINEDLIGISKGIPIYK